MKTYCVKCRKNTQNFNSKIFKTKNDRLPMQSKCPVCRIKKSRFVKEQEAKGLSSKLGTKTPLSKFFFTSFVIKSLVEVVLLMNQIINWQMSFINQLLENLKKEKFIHHLETIFGALN